MMGTQSAISYVEYLSNAGMIMFKASLFCEYSCRYKMAISIVRFSLLNRVAIEPSWLPDFVGELVSFCSVCTR